MTGTGSEPGRLRLGLAGDVMTGRGVDQIQARPGDPELYERAVTSADVYVTLAEENSGPIPRAVDPDYIWGDLLPVLRSSSLDAVVVNLETAVTDQGTPWPDKGVHYRMHPANIGCLTVGAIDVVSLANNHVLDWSQPGLEQTLDVLDQAGLKSTGAGLTGSGAWTPAFVEPRSGPRILVIAVGTESSGIPHEWTARPDRPGVALLPESPRSAVARVSEVMELWSEPGDIVVVSVHWGGNWGYEIPDRRRDVAHALIDEAGVHLIHGHSSHHPLGLEVHNGHLVIHGCGDLITDYEGIGSHDEYRGHLGGFYLPTLDARDGTLRELEIVPTTMQRFRLVSPTEPDRQWLAATLNRESARFGVTVVETGEARLRGRW